MSKHNVIELDGRAEISDPLTELLKNGARQLIQQAVEAELQELLEVHKDRRLANGNAAVVRNGYLPRVRFKRVWDRSRFAFPKSAPKVGSLSLSVPPWYRPMFAKHAPWKRPSRGST